MSCVIYHEENGIFLGDDAGSPVWSKRNPNGQDSAITFKNPDAAFYYTSLWTVEIPNLMTRFVRPDYGRYASMEACVDAGLPPWNSDKDVSR